MMATRVLLVDDEPELLQALCVRLRAAGFVCETARNGQEGLAKTQAWQPALIVTDLIMPQMDGYEMCRQLKADAQTARIPVVILTAVAERSLMHRAEELGAARLIRKPFDSKELLATIQDVLTVPPHGGLADG